MTKAAKPRLRVIRGGGGAKKPPKMPVLPEPAEPPRVFPDSLFSKQEAVLVDILSEGPIKAIHDVYINEGLAKPRDFKPQIRLGTADQLPLGERFPASQETVNIGGIQVRSPELELPLITDPDINRVTVTYRIGSLYQTDKEGNIADAVVKGELWLVDSGGQIVSKANGHWGKKKSWTISGKTTTGDYQFTRELEVGTADDLPNPPAFPLTVRTRKITRSESSQNARNDVYVQYMGLIVDEVIQYKHTAVVGAIVKADRYPGIPDRAYDASGILCYVPSNRQSDPDSPSYRFYSGDWDGTFVEEWTDNPAWVGYTLIVNNRFGLGDWLGTTPPDKWSLYQIGKYCDAMVPSGRRDQGGNDIYEPRYRFNSYLTNREQAIDFLQRFFGSFRTMLYYSGQHLVASCDMPRDRVAIFNPANVRRDQGFKYQGISITSRFTEFHVRWNDPQYFFMPRYEVVTDESALSQFGQHMAQLTPFGCTSQGQARRAGKAGLEDTRAGEVVSFQTGQEGMRLRPGDRIGVADPRRNSKLTGGRLLAAAGEGQMSYVTVDRDIEFDPDHSYLFHTILPDQEETITAAPDADELVISKMPLDENYRFVKVWQADALGEFIDPVTGEPHTVVEPIGLEVGAQILLKIRPASPPGAPARLYRVQYAVGVSSHFVVQGGMFGEIEGRRFAVAPPMEDVPLDYALWTVEDVTAGEEIIKDYRVLHVGEKEAYYEVTALAFDPEKFDRIDLLNTDLEDDEGTPGKFILLPQPSDLHATVRFRVNNAGIRECYVDLDWTDIDSEVYSTFSHYEVFWAGPGMPTLRELPGPIRNSQVDIGPLTSGRYQFVVQAATVFGERSPAAYLTYDVDAGTPWIETAEITGLRLEAQEGVPFGQFKGRDAKITWNAPTAGAGTLYGYQFRVRMFETPGSIVVNLALPRTEGHTFTLEENAHAPFGPHRKFWVEVAARDQTGQTGPYSKILCENPAPPELTGVQLYGGWTSTWLRANFIRDIDAMGFIVWASTEPGFVPKNGEQGNEVYRGTTIPINFETLGDTKYYVRAAQYDVFSDDPELLNLTSEMTVTTAGFSIPDHSLDPSLVFIQGNIAWIEEGYFKTAVIDSAFIKEAAIKTNLIQNIAVTHTQTKYGPYQGQWYNVFPAYPMDSVSGLSPWVTLINFYVYTEHADSTLSFILDFGMRINDILPRIGHPYQATLYGVDKTASGGGVDWPAAVPFGQKQPRVRFRIIHNLFTNPDPFWTSERENLSIAGYRNIQMPIPYHQPGPNWYPGNQYTVQMQCEDAIYDEGTCARYNDHQYEFTASALIAQFAQRGDWIRVQTTSAPGSWSAWQPIKWVAENKNRIRIRDAWTTVNTQGFVPYQIRNQSFLGWMGSDAGDPHAIPAEAKWPSGYLDLDIRNVKVHVLETKR